MLTVAVYETRENFKWFWGVGYGGCWTHASKSGRYLGQPKNGIYQSINQICVNPKLVGDLELDI